MARVFGTSSKFDHQSNINVLANKLQSICEGPVCLGKEDPAVERRRLVDNAPALSGGADTNDAEFVVPELDDLELSRIAESTVAGVYVFQEAQNIRRRKEIGRAHV